VAIQTNVVRHNNTGGPVNHNKAADTTYIGGATKHGISFHAIYQTSADNLPAADNGTTHGQEQSSPLASTKHLCPKESTSE